MNRDFDRIIETLESLLEKKTSEYEIYLSSTKGTSVEAKEGKTDAYKQRLSVGVGLRIIMDNRPGYGFSNIFTHDALKDMVSLSMAGSKGADSDAFLSFPHPAAESPFSESDILDGDFDKSTQEEIVSKALAMENDAFGFDARVKRVRKATYGETLNVSRTVNSKGVDCIYKGTFFSGSVLAVAEDKGDSQMGWEAGMGHKKRDVDAKDIGLGAAKRAVELLGAKPITTRRVPAVFENVAVMELMEALSSSFLSNNVQKGKSMFAMDKVDKPVMSSHLNIFDDATLPGGWATSLYDCEGVKRQKTPLVLKGVLAGFLSDTYWAKRMGRTSTGNAVRAGFKGSESVGASNLYMEKGDKTLAELLKEMERGIFIKELMGVHTIDSVSGDFSLGMTGMWVEGGQIVHPVRGVAMAGNLLELFSTVEMVGSDMRFMASIGSPSILFGAIDISGGSQ